MIYNFPRKQRKRITKYLTFSSPNPFSVAVDDYPQWNSMYYSKDGEAWADWSGSEISAAPKDGAYVLCFAGLGNTSVTFNGDNTWKIQGTDVSCNGNIETLLDYEKVALGQHPEMEAGCYVAMFSQCTALVTAPELPATKLTDRCYQMMFRGTSLVEAPKLPATELESSCYYYMFYECASLITAPKLPAMKLAETCYTSMFNGCTSLTAAPSLPATTLAANCYFRMFNGCTSIKLAISKSLEYDKEYRIPKSGDGVTATNAMRNMFNQTGGTFTGTPSINTTYYTSNTIV